MCSIHLIQYRRRKRILRHGPSLNNSAPPINTLASASRSHSATRNSKGLKSSRRSKPRIRPHSGCSTLGIAAGALVRRYRTELKPLRLCTIPRSADDASARRDRNRTVAASWRSQKESAEEERVRAGKESAREVKARAGEKGCCEEPCSFEEARPCEEGTGEESCPCRKLNPNVVMV